MSKRNENGLNDQQERFCQEYIVDLNGKQAAIRAGYSSEGAEVRASKLLATPKIQARVNELKQMRAKRTEITADKVLAELASIGFATLDPDVLVKQMVDAMTQGIDPRSLPRPGYPDKIKALELLGKHLKLFTDKHEHTGKDGAPIQFTDHEAAAKLAAILNAAKSRKDSEGSEGT